MRILIITGSHPPLKCGVGDYTAKLAETLTATKEVEIAVLTDAAIDRCTGDAPYKVIASIRTWTLRDTFRVISSVKKYDPDIVHIQFPTQAYRDNLFPWMIPMILHWTGYTVVQTWHEQYPCRWEGLINGWVPGGLVVVRPNYKTNKPSWFLKIISNKEFRFIPNASAIPAVKLSAEERRAIRERFDGINRSLIVYFGFVSPIKGIETIFEICNPDRNRIVLICELDPDIPYHRTVLQLMNGSRWRGKCFTTGFLPPIEVARILASADAVMLPFTVGGGPWNTSVHGVCAQGTFLMTTSNETNGYFPAENIYYATPGNTQDMKHALETYVGTRKENPTDPSSDWNEIASAHIALYKSLQCRRQAETRDA